MRNFVTASDGTKEITTWTCASTLPPPRQTPDVQFGRGHGTFRLGADEGLCGRSKKKPMIWTAGASLSS